MSKLSLIQRIRNRIFCYLPLPYHYGRDFRRIYDRLLQSRNWSREQLQAYKLEKLRALVDYAGRNVPYYRDLFKRIGLQSGDIKSFGDYARIPVLSKETLRNNLEALKAENFDSFKPFRTQTSGTTSRMTTLYRSSYLEAFRKAVVWRYFSEHGHNFRDRWIKFALRSFDPDSPVCEFNRLENCLIINTYHIIRGVRQEIIDAILDFKPNLIWTHPSPFGILAEYINSNNLPKIEIPVISFFSEKMFPHVRREIERAFPARYIEYYGNRENSFAAWGNLDDHFYEVSEYCHTEVENLQADGLTGDLITTSLHNYAVPLIRYDPGDVVRWHGYQDEQTPYPVIELLGGRGKDILVTRNGLTVPYFLAYIDAKNFNKLHKYQIRQTSLDEVDLRVVPRENYDREVDEPLLLKYASESFANNFKINLEYVDDIPLTESGKYRSVISKPAVEYFDRKKTDSVGS